MPEPYPAEFRDDVVAVVRKREAPLKQIAKDFGASEGCLSTWLKKADVEDGNRPGIGMLVCRCSVPWAICIRCRIPRLRGSRGRRGATQRSRRCAKAVDALGSHSAIEQYADFIATTRKQRQQWLLTERQSPAVSWWPDGALPAPEFPPLPVN